MKSSIAMYRSIAVDLAQRIVNGEYSVHEKISGRSLLASHYNVSPETVRKAIALLKVKNVVSVSQGKEVTVLSPENAYSFVEHYKSTDSVDSLHHDVEQLLQQKREIDARLENLLTDIINYSDKLRNLTPYNPVEVEVPAASHIIGHKIAEIRLWQHTGATIVAIRRAGSIIISPGPDAIIQAHDRIVVVGNHEILTKTTNFVNSPV